jgi:hypothetical protein
MTAAELMAFQIKEVESQLMRAYDGLPENVWDMKLLPDGMSPRRILEHLAECCTAATTEMRGGKHNWGTYKASDTSPQGLMETWKALRQEAVDTMLSNPTDKVLTDCVEYLCLHDAYHVGQLAAIRMQGQPDWDAYSIYAH